MKEASSSQDEYDLIVHTTEIVCAFMENNKIASDSLPDLITSVHGALTGLVAGEPIEESPEPAVSIRSSVKPDYLVCLEDGQKLKMLKRYLRTNYDMSPEEYRERWDLPADYPMVAPNYSERRRQLAKDIGLGKAANPNRGRKKKS